MPLYKFSFRKIIAIGLILTCSFANATFKKPFHGNGIENNSYYGFETWGRKQAIIIDASQVSSDLANFPMLITLEHLNEEVVDAGTYSALNGGGDLRFSSDPDGNIPLAAEIVSFVTSSNPSNRKCQIWIKVPFISSTVNTTIYVWYNKPGETQPISTSTYGSQSVWSEYDAVWHMDSSPAGTVPDVTGNGHDLTSTGSMGAGNLVSGAIDGAIQFDGVDDELVLSSPLSYNSSLSFSSIFNWSGSGQYGGLLANKSPWSGFWVNNGGGGRTLFYNGVSQEFSNIGIFTSNVPTKYDFVATNGDFQHFYGGTGDLSGTNTVGSGSFAFVGSEGGSAFFSGWIDEMRVTSLSRSQAWLQAEEKNQINPATFATKGTSTGVSGSGSPGNGFWTSNGDAIYNLNNVAIGRNSIPTGYKLAVDGKLRAREIRVDADSWPDYVFEKNYRLISLEEIKKHIQENGHLPNIPPATEMEAKGVQLGIMNNRLMQKIEELTLYLIEQNKRIKKLDHEIINKE